jgi:UDP-N-acetylglucosamine--N-acetylmuramyl-(pentapeptide) pyrophosphoryl-undecaprenol N-acetylglucosamine transferase
LKTLARSADCIAVAAEDSRRYFKRPERVHTTGYPTRADLGKWTRAKARQTLKLDSQAPVLLVSGGSKGARSINNAVLGVLPELLERTQVVHLSGELDWPVVEARMKSLLPVQAARYHAFPYLHEQMGAALAAADLALSRAGASTLGEYPLFGLPAILVPYPYAWRYQKVNAVALARHEAAVIIEDADLPGQLLAIVDGLLGHPQKLAAMRQAMQRLSHPQAAAEIGRLLLALPGERRSERG